MSQLRIAECDVTETIGTELWEITYGLIQLRVIAGKYIQVVKIAIIERNTRTKQKNLIFLSKYSIKLFP